MDINAEAHPLVSIIVPMYNAEETIGRAIRSCLDQTMPDLEVIVVDDASTDGSRQVVEQIGDPRIRLLSMPVNSGPADARNRALDVAVGRWITFLDADDFFLPSRLGRLLEEAESAPPYSVISDHFAARKARETLRVEVFAPEDMIPNSVHGQFLIKRTHLEASGARFPSGIRNGEDTAFHLNVMSVPGSRLVRIPDRLYWYSLKKGSLTTRSDRYLDVVRAYQYVLDEGKVNFTIRRQIEGAIERLALEHVYESTQAHIRRGRPDLAIRLLSKHPVVLRMAAERAPRALMIHWRRRVLRRGRV